MHTGAEWDAAHVFSFLLGPFIATVQIFLGHGHGQQMPYLHLEDAVRESVLKIRVKISTPTTCV